MKALNAYRSPVTPASNDAQPAALVQGFCAQVLALEAAPSGETLYRLGSSSENSSFATTTAQRAESLLVQPEVGDRVFYIEVEREYFIVHILKRKTVTAPLVMQTARPMDWIAPVIRLKALEEMQFLSVNKLSLSACDVVLSACQTLVQQARHFLQQAKNFSLTTKGLIRVSGRQQVITAEEDLRMDAKRINMG